MSWQEIEFQDFIKLQRGFDLPVSKMKGGDVPVLGSNGILGYHNEAKQQPPGVITGRSGSLGIVQFTDKPFWPHNTSLWVKDFKKNNPRFVYYKLQTLHLERFNGGVSVPTLNRNVLDTIRIHIPDGNLQKRLADILRPYDDLIENNRRRIQLLEQAARLLYKEWFVHLRFPGHDHVKINDGVPEGWSRKALSELAESVTYGYTASAQTQPLGPKFLRITDIVPDVIDWTSVPYCQISENDLGKFCIREGDVVVARTGATVGYAKRIGNLEHASVFASYLVRLHFSDEIDDMIAGIFMESSEYKAFIKNHCGGAAQPNANAKVLSAAKILVPPKWIQKEFHRTVEPILKQKEFLQQQNQKLKQARDLLLPRLMNGDIAV